MTKKNAGPEPLGTDPAHEDGGDLLSRIAVQYHRRGRA